MKKRIIIFVAALAAALSPVPTMAGEPLKGDIAPEKCISVWVFPSKSIQ